MVSSKHKKQKVGQSIIDENDSKMLENIVDAKENINNITPEATDFTQKISKKNKKRKQKKLEKEHNEIITIDLAKSDGGSITIFKKKRKSKSNQETVPNSNELEDNENDFADSHSHKKKKKRHSDNTDKDFDSKPESQDLNDSLNKNTHVSSIKKKKNNMQDTSSKYTSEKDVAISEKDLNESQNDLTEDNKNKNRKRGKRSNSNGDPSVNRNLNLESPPNKKVKKGSSQENSNEKINNRQRKISEDLPFQRQRKTSEESPVKGVQQLDRNSEKSVVVENLPIKFLLRYKQRLRKHFEKCGEIVYLGKAQFFPNEDKKLKFSTLIVFKEEESVQKALEEDNLKFKDARIRVKKLPALVDSTIFVHSRSTLDQATLSTIFSPSGKISNILEVKHNTAFVQFSDPSSVPRALTLATEAKVCGNRIVASRYKLRPQTESEIKISVKERSENKDDTKNEASDDTL